MSKVQTPTVKIKTNNAPRPLVPLCDLPKNVQADFDYVNEDDYECRFVQYKGTWYDVFDTQVVGTARGGSAVVGFEGWDSFLSDSFFSGVLFRMVGESHVVCGTYTC